MINVLFSVSGNSVLSYAQKVKTTSEKKKTVLLSVNLATLILQRFTKNHESFLEYGVRNFIVSFVLKKKIPVCRI
jgi:hypothetical protein